MDWVNLPQVMNKWQASCVLSDSISVGNFWTS